jgi:hypothetical protein
MPRLLIVTSLLIGCCGVECEEFQSVFRREATQQIGNGLVTIFTGVVDGTVAAITELGDDNDNADTGGDGGATE